MKSLQLTGAQSKQIRKTNAAPRRVSRLWHKGFSFALIEKAAESLVHTDHIYLYHANTKTA